MKKIYTLISAIVLFSGTSKAQLSLTKAVNEPVVGDIDYQKNFDSSIVLPRNTGANQFWNFDAAVTSNTNALTIVTYTTPASIPGGTAYPSATLGQTDGTNNSFFKSTTTNFEMLSLVTTSATLDFTNTAIIASWPINFGYTSTDPVAGNVNTQFGAGTFTGNIVTNASGSGTIQLPGALTYTNVLQVVSRMTAEAVISGPFPVTATLTVINYQYYHSSQKFPLLTMSTNIIDNSVIGTQEVTTVNVNNLVYTGINEFNLDNTYSIYPNPATGNFHVILNNPKSESVSIEITDQLGKAIKKQSLGSSDINTSIDISGINAGIYFIKTILGERSTTKKLIIQ